MLVLWREARKGTGILCSCAIMQLDILRHMLERCHLKVDCIRNFSHVGIPKEVLTDQGPNCISHTLKQVYQLLGIKRVQTTPFHPQSDVLVEIFNQTLKSSN